MKKVQRIIYFIKGPVPSEAVLAESKQMDGNVVFRNACYVSDTDAPEACDAVAGAVPKLYKKDYKRIAAKTEVKAAAKTAAKPAAKTEVKAVVADKAVTKPADDAVTWGTKPATGKMT